MKKYGLMMMVGALAMGAMCFTAPAQEMDTPESPGVFATLDAGERIWAGNLVGVSTNGLAYMVSNTNVALSAIIGRAEATVNEGAAITVKRGTFRFPNLGVTTASLGAAVYWGADTNGVQGVAGSAGSGGFSAVVGTLSNIDGDGAWVRIGK